MKQDWVPVPDVSASLEHIGETADASYMRLAWRRDSRS